MEQAQEAATETKAEGLGAFRFKGQRRVIQLQLLQGLPEVVKLGIIGRVQSSVDHRRHLPVTLQRFVSRVIGVRDGITDPGILDVLNGCGDVANIPRHQDVPGQGLR